jgi:hypothetical protein
MRPDRAIRGLLVGVPLLGVLLALVACTQSGAVLVDESGAVSEWRYHPAPVVVDFADLDEFAAMEAAGALQVTAPEGWDVRVVWGTQPCRTRPTIRVHGSATAIAAIEVDHGPAPGDCADSLEIHAVDLRVSPGTATTGIVVSGRGKG